MHKVVIIEDNPFDYQKVAAKILEYEKHEKFQFLPQIPLVTEEVSYNDFIKKLIDNQGDIYIVDWQLQFKEGMYNPREIFQKLSTISKFDLFSKFWIFYSGKDGNAASELLTEYFSLRNNYWTPGKRHIVGEIGKRGIDHLQVCLERGATVLNDFKAENWEKPISFTTKIVLDSSGDSFYNIEYPMKKEYKRERLSLYKEGVCCLAYNDPDGILIYLDENKMLNIYYVHTSHSFKKIKEALDLSTAKSFIYNPFFFSGKILREEYKKFIAAKLKLLKPEYPYPLNVLYQTVNLTKQIATLKDHGLPVN